jgi:nucleoside-diphosphate-sugar epimerase
MKTLVTGGCGFLGAHVVRELTVHGHEVVVADARLATDNLRIAWADEVPELQIEQVDVTDPLGLLRVLKSHQIENVVHLAYLLGSAADRDPMAAIKVNIEGATGLWELARSVPLRRIVWASSGAVFARSFRAEEPLHDGSRPSPAALYGHSKFFNEFIAEHYYRQFGVDSIGLRPFVVYGLGKPGGLTLELLKALVVNPVLGRSSIVPFPNDRIPWLDVEEAAIGFRVAIEHDGPPPSRLYNFRGDPVNVGTMMDYVRELIPGSELRAGSGRAWGGKNEVYRDDFGAAMQQDLGFQASMTGRQMLERAIERVNESRALIEELFPEG